MIMSASAWVVMLAMMLQPSAPWDPPIDTNSWNYRYGERNITLERDETRAAVLLSETHNELQRLQELLADEPAFRPLRETDRQTYQKLWFPRFSPRFTWSQRLSALDRLTTREGIQFATVVLRYGATLLVPTAEILVTLETGESSAALRNSPACAGLGFVREFSLLSPVVHLTTGTPRQAFIRSGMLSQQPGVITAEPNFIISMKPHATPNDPLFRDQWAHNNTGQTAGSPGADLSSLAAWDTAVGNPALVVAILDEGVDVEHEDLVAHIVTGHDSTDQAPPAGVPGNASSAEAHGTACAGIAAAVGDNGVGVTGVSWRASIMPVRLGYGSVWTQTVWITDAITWAVDHGADILSNSWGGGAPSTAVQSALEYATTVGRAGLGCVVLFSAGNQNSGMGYPESYPETIAVGATSPCDERKSPSSCDGETWWGSNFGPELDIVAPGVAILTTDNMGGSGFSAGAYVSNFSGTSAACPHVAGAAALLLSVRPNLTVEDVRSYIENSGDDQVGTSSEDLPGWDPYMGWGRLNLDTLMQLSGIPRPVSDLICVEIGGDAILNWTNPESFTGIEVNRNGTLIATLSGTVTSYTDSTPPSGSQNYVLTPLSGDTSGVSTGCGVTIAPLPVAGLSCALGQGSILLTWTNPSSYSYIELERNGIVIATLVGSTTSYVDNSPGSGAHLYVVTAVSSSMSAEGQQCTVNIPPAPIGSLACVQTTDNIVLSWLNQEAYDALEIHREGTFIASLTGFATGYTDGPLLPGVYEYAVTPILEGLTASAESCSASVLSPPPVGGITCTVEATAADLTWIIQDSYTTLEVRRDGMLIATLLGNAVSHTDDSPGIGRHTYAITARLASLASSSAQCSLTITPSPVTGMMCGQFGGGVEIEWTNPAPYTQIDLQRDGRLIATLGGDAISHFDALPAVGAHSYAVTAYADATASSPNTCNVTFATSVPISGLQCRQDGPDVALNWVSGDSYTVIEIVRDGIPLVNLPAAATSYIDGFARAESMVYEVTGVEGSTVVTASSCQIDFSVPPVSDLTCTSSGSGAELSWAALAPGYRQIEVVRDGTSIAMLPGSSTSFFDDDATGGVHTYEIFAYFGLVASPSAGCVPEVLPNAVTNFECSQSGNGTQLTWINSADYDTLELRRNGVLIATLAGSSGDFFDTSPREGDHQYDIRGVSSGVSSSPELCSVSIDLPTSILTAASFAGTPGENALSHFVLATNEIPLRGFSFGLDFDDTLLTVTDVNTDNTVTGAVNAEFFAPALNNEPGGGYYTVGVFIDVFPPIDNLLPPGTAQPVVHAAFAVKQTAPVGSISALALPLAIGNPPVIRTFGFADDTGLTPDAIQGLFVIVSGDLFVRGDANLDGAVNLGDGISMLNYLFLQGTSSCLDAADFNGDDVVDISDPVSVLDYLFLAGSFPAPPFPDCGTDATGDGIDCGSYPGCP